MLKKLSINCQISSDYDLISKSKSIILPGVGNFLTGMSKLHEKKIDKAIFNAIQNESKFLGICLGMALLFDHSEEDNCEGLKLINGNVKKFNDKNFKDSGIKALAKIAAEINASIENIGARRLYTILEKVFEDLSFTAPDNKEKVIVIDKNFVDKNLDKFVKSNDVSRYVL